MHFVLLRRRFFCKQQALKALSRQWAMGKAGREKKEGRYLDEFLLYKWISKVHNNPHYTGVRQWLKEQ
jgi:hypothetical protein